MKTRVICTILPVMTASIFFDIIIVSITGSIPWWFDYAKITFLLGATVLFLFIKGLRPLIKLTVILTAIIAANVLSDFITTSSLWNSAFKSNSFIGNFGSSILLKLISVIPIVIILLIMLKSAKAFYLTKGNLSAKAERIAWLGIDADSIPWLKLSIISAVLISIVTILLTIFTVTSASLSKGIDQLPKYLPMIILFALLNSFCEGVLFRCTILGTLRNVLPKNYTIIIATVFFGMAHYYGAPGGVVGVIMSSLLGWYMCRSMYETNGFVSSWIIHSMQDAVIFSTIYMFGNFT